MYKNNKIMALVPARGGSKGIPRKNIIPFGGRPLISYVIKSGLRSRYLDAVYVSSDSEEILEVAKKYGARILKRPKYLAGDKSATIDTEKHALQVLSKRGEKYDYLLLLQPTSPFTRHQDIDMAIEQLFKDGNDMLISVTSSHMPPDLLIFIKDRNLYFHNNKYFYDIRRQNLPQYYMFNGAIYIYKREIVLSAKSYPYIRGKTSAYIMPKHQSIEIDSPEDLLIATSIRRDIKKYAALHKSRK